MPEVLARHHGHEVKEYTHALPCILFKLMNIMRRLDGLGDLPKPKEKYKQRRSCGKMSKLEEYYKLKKYSAEKCEMCVNNAIEKRCDVCARIEKLYYELVQELGHEDF